MRSRFSLAAACALLGLSLVIACTPAPAARDSAPIARSRLTTAKVAPDPPPSHPRRPVLVLLHGMCAKPEWVCPWFPDGMGSGRWVVCPRGQLPCGGDLASWDVRGSGAVIAASLSGLAEAHPGEVAGQDAVIFGFSQGATAALDAAERSHGVYRGLILAAADLAPDAKRLRAAGIQRVVMAAGELDGSFYAMKRSARSLDARGVPTRFMSLGRVGHTFPSDMRERMKAAMEWIDGED